MKECSCERCNRNEENWDGRFLKYNGKTYCEKHQRQLKTKGEITDYKPSVYNVGINNMPKGWASENKWNKNVYRKWHNMLERCYSEEYHKKQPTYIECIVCQRWLLLSNFVNDFKNINGYDEIKFLNDELCLDKDIKSNGINKCYCLEECMLISKTENSRQANKTRNYKKGVNSPLYGKNKTDEHKKNLSISHMGNSFGAKQVYQYDLKGNLIKKWDCLKQISKELDISYYMLKKTINGKRNTYEYKNYIWKYVEEENK